MQLSTRPEIRKGCVWEVQCTVSEPYASSIKEFSPTKINGTFPYLHLVVKSKLLKTEIAFAKVGQLLHEDKPFKIDKGNTVVLHIKFTARPRAVFQKHSDMMILVATIKKGEQTLCAGETELIFRGGTGSAHSADSRKGGPKGGVSGGVGMIQAQDASGLLMGLQGQGFPMMRGVPSPLGIKQEVGPMGGYAMPAHAFPHMNGAMLPPHLQPFPGVMGHPASLNGLSNPLHFQPQSQYQFQMEQFCMTQLAPRVEEFDSQELWNDFLQNKGSIDTSSIHQSFDDLIKTDLWSESANFISHPHNNSASNNTNDDHLNNDEMGVALDQSDSLVTRLDNDASGKFGANLSVSNNNSTNSNTVSDNHMAPFAAGQSEPPVSLPIKREENTNSSDNNNVEEIEIEIVEAPKSERKDDSIPSKPASNLVTSANSSGIDLKSDGDATTNSNHVGNVPIPHGEIVTAELLKPHESMDGEDETARKRKFDQLQDGRSNPNSQSSNSNGSLTKKSKHDSTFQNMFFLCLHFMTLPQIAGVCSTSPLPIFVKNSNSVFIYINPAFCNFIMGVSGVESVVLNKTGVQDVLESREESSTVIDQDKWILTQEEGAIKTFQSIFNQKSYQVLKQWVTLPDGQRVIIGVIIIQ